MTIFGPNKRGLKLDVTVADKKEANKLGGEISYHLAECTKAESCFLCKEKKAKVVTYTTGLEVRGVLSQT